MEEIELERLAEKYDLYSPIDHETADSLNRYYSKLRNIFY